jgi:curved DNA-binding protein CbpA
MMTTDENQLRAAIARYVDQAYATLDQVDYYRVLGVSSAATEEELRGAYYRLATRLHPDIHGDAIDRGFRERLTAVYSRVVEAYKVLSNPQRRADYDGALSRGDMRLQAGSKVRPKAPEESIQNPKARQFYKLAQAALNDRNVAAAVMNLRLALTMEPDNELIKELLAKTGTGGR